MPKKKIELTGIFRAVTQSLEANQQTLDQADTHNQDHGSNMVQTFQIITSALEKKKKSSDSAALAYAAKALSKSTTSSSGQLYAQNLSEAAARFKGKPVDAQGALQLLQTLIGSQGGVSSAAGGGDMLNSLLGGLSGAETQQQAAQTGGDDLLGALLGGFGGQPAPVQQPSPAGGGDLFGMLLGGLTGGSTTSGGGQQAGGLDLQDLLSAGMAFMQAKQQGQGNLQALVQAIAASSGMGSSSHRSQSTQIVVESYLQALTQAKKPA
jgi:hypothetical protein